MAVTINACCVIGFDCHHTKVEVEIVNGPSSFEIVGLGDAAVQEAKQRVYSAIKNSGAEFPRRRKIINLAPADLKKYGPLFDLPMAIGLLAASGQLKTEIFKNSIAIGELALSGEVRPVRGVLPIAAFATEQGFKKIFLPEENAAEASLVPEIEIYGIRHISEILAGNFRPWTKNNEPETSNKLREFSADIYFEDIRGQEFAKRGLMIAAAGGHNLLMNGPPGSGKTMLSKALLGILPPLSFQEAMEVTKIYSLCGKVSRGNPLMQERPLRAIHHTISSAALVGGGAIPHPGEISLAHRGILFLDEMPEFPRSVLEVLRQPLEDGTIAVNRASYRTVFPARFMLIGAMNPCPCGFANDQKKSCLCSPSSIRQYSKKLSGPLLDRIDLFLSVPRLEFETLDRKNTGETSETIKGKIIAARKIQLERFAKKNIFTNSEMSSKDTVIHCPLSREGRNLLKQAAQQLHLSGRAYFRILKISRTMADLENAACIEAHHVAEALQYRTNV